MKTKEELINLFRTRLASLTEELDVLLEEDNEDMLGVDLFLDEDEDNLLDQAILESQISMLEWVLDEVQSMK